MPLTVNKLGVLTNVNVISGLDGTNITTPDSDTGGGGPDGNEDGKDLLKFRFKQKQATA